MLKHQITAKNQLGLVFSNFPHESPDAKSQTHKTLGRFMAKTACRQRQKYAYTELGLSLEPAPSPL